MNKTGMFLSIASIFNSWLLIFTCVDIIQLDKEGLLIILFTLNSFCSLWILTRIENDRE